MDNTWEVIGLAALAAWFAMFGTLSAKDSLLGGTGFSLMALGTLLILLNVFIGLGVILAGYIVLIVAGERAIKAL